MAPTSSLVQHLVEVFVIGTVYSILKDIVKEHVLRAARHTKRRSAAILQEARLDGQLALSVALAVGAIACLGLAWYNAHHGISWGRSDEWINDKALALGLPPLLPAPRQPEPSALAKLEGSIAAHPFVQGARSLALWCRENPGTFAAIVSLLTVFDFLNLFSRLDKFDPIAGLLLRGGRALWSFLGGPVRRLLRLVLRLRAGA